MESLTIILVVVISIALFLTVFKKLITKIAVLFVNSVVGLILLALGNIYLGFNIPITAPTIIVCGLFGVPAVATLIILHLFRII